MRNREDLKKKLKLNFVNYTNKTLKVGDYDMLKMHMHIDPKIDYIASYSNPGSYVKTNNTAVGFFQNDCKFDGKNGIWEAIDSDDQKRLDFFKERFRYVKYFIAPDYSKTGDIDLVENLYRNKKSRTVAIWLTFNTDAVVIPLISCGLIREMGYVLDGLEDCVIVAFNMIGQTENEEQLKEFKKSIKITADRLTKLKSIVVNTTSIDDNKVYEVFDYAIAKGITIQIPSNSLRESNLKKGGE